MSGGASTDIWIAGAFAAFSVDLLVYPLDTLKTRIQSPDYRRLYVHESTNTIQKAALFRGLYQGIGSVILATLPSSGAFFTTYETAKSLLSPLPTPLTHALSSSLAECVSCAILTPAEVIKQNAQMVSRNPSLNPSTTYISPTRQTLRRFKRNPLALWRGYGALTSRNLPFTALQFPLFERLRDGAVEWRKERRIGRVGVSGQGSGVQRDRSAPGSRRDTRASQEEKGEEETILARFTTTSLSAGLAGAVAAVLTTPVDVVKTRIMLGAASSFAAQPDPSSSSSNADASRKAVDARNKAIDAVREGKVGRAMGVVTESATTTSSDPNPNGGEDRRGGPGKKPSSMAIAQGIVREQGWKGLWRGGALRGAWTMLGSGLYLGCYESGRVWLERRDGDRGEDGGTVG